VVDTRHEYDRLANLYLPIAAGVVLLVLVLVVAFALRYRARPGPGDGAAAGEPRAGGRRPPSQRSSAPGAEALYVLALAAVAALLLWRTFGIEGNVDAAANDRAAVTVDVTAAKWHWTFAYPRLGIVQRGTDTRRPALVVPAGQTVAFRMRSVDVVHAFWIPSRRFKRDATPGFPTRFALTFPRPGTWANGGECSEYCGLRHWQMRFDVRVLSSRAFASWVRARQSVRAGTAGPAASATATGAAR
jgi:cytochrome c oxidase subunit 2